MLGASVAGAQVPATLAGRRVVGGRVEGELGAVDASTGIAPGATLSRALVRRATEQLLATGRWADVQIDVEVAPGGVELVVRVVPRVLVGRVDIDGNEALSDDDVRAPIVLDPDGELDDS